MRISLAVFLFMVCPALPAAAQEAPAEEVPGAAAEEATVPAPPEPPENAPKIAVVVVGDPDAALRRTAERIERSVSAQLRIPFDAAMRAALRGEPGEPNDGLDSIRRQRRGLGGSEAQDAPVIAGLGRRAGATAVAVVRAGERGPEVLILDVRNAAFFEGNLTLDAELEDARLARFVVRRVSLSARGTAAPSAPAARRRAPHPAPDRRPAELVFFETYWPYMLAAVLLAGMITAIALTSSGSDGASQPVLRFIPGGR